MRLHFLVAWAMSILTSSLVLAENVDYWQSKSQMETAYEQKDNSYRRLLASSFQLDIQQFSTQAEKASESQDSSVFHPMV